MTVHQHTPSSRATTATGRASSPTWRVASAPARNVSTARGATCSVPSVHVLAAQSGSPQRQRRFSHTSRAGRPKQGRSRISTRIRSLASARTPQLGHPTKSAVVSTVTITSEGVSSTASTAKPVESQQRLSQASSVIHRQGSSSLESSRNLNDVGTPGRVRGYLATSHSPVQREEPNNLAVSGSPRVKRSRLGTDADQGAKGRSVIVGWPICRRSTTNQGRSRDGDRITFAGRRRP